MVGANVVVETAGEGEGTEGAGTGEGPPSDGSRF